MPLLVVLAGPIASGKSTIAERLARQLAADRAGTTAALVDLDDLAFAQRGTQELPELWRRAAAVAGATVRAGFAAGTDVVIAHGPFFESDGYRLLLDDLPPETVVRHVLLRVPVPVALERVAADPSRGLSRDPEFLRSTHDHFAQIEHRLPVPDLTFDTSTHAAADVAADLARALRP